MRIYGTGKIIEEVISLIVFPCIKVRSDPYCCDLLLNPILFYYNNLLFSPEPPDPPDPLLGNTQTLRWLSNTRLEGHWKQ